MEYLMYLVTDSNVILSLYIALMRNSEISLYSFLQDSFKS